MNGDDEIKRGVDVIDSGSLAEVIKRRRELERQACQPLSGIECAQAILVIVVLALAVIVAIVGSAY